MKKGLACMVLWLLRSQMIFAQSPDSGKQKDWSYHFQLTVIDQIHSGFKSPYSGTNSLADTVEPGATSITTTLFFGRRLWKGGAFYFDPEMSGGHGLSAAVGVAGALNGETYRIGDPSPVVTIARAYYQQVIPLDHTQFDGVDDDINQLQGPLPARRIVISAGKFSISDFYDKNSCSHDPRTSFINWGLMSNGAWDYPANTRGYTEGLVAELIQPKWELRVSTVAVPVIANHSEMEFKLSKAHSESVEISRKFTMHNHPGIVSLLFSYTAERSPSYQQGLAALKTGDSAILLDISGNAKPTAYGGNKTGVYLNLEQELTRDLGLFARLGWNDGKHVTWAFTEIDQAASVGLCLKGARWKRKDDVVGIAGLLNGISNDHRTFLKAGGYGFIIGDGNLNYGHEGIIETYYSARVTDSFWFTFDYQFVHNPGYNKDRSGPVHVFAARAHVAF